MADNKVEKVSTKVTVEDLAKNVEVEIDNAFKTNVAMSEIRQKAHTLILNYGKDMDLEARRQFARAVQERFDTRRRFAEAMYTEVVSASTQQGW
jgi:hypothetical protein